MNLRALFVLGGALAISGCSSGANGPSTPVPSSPSAGSPTSAASTATPALAATSSSKTSTVAPVATSGPNPALAAASGQYEKGKVSLKQGNFTQAQSFFRNAIQHKDHVGAAYVGLGTAAVYAHRYPDAVKAFTQALVYSPRDASIVYQTAFAALYAQDYRKSVRYSTSFISMRPNDAAGYRLRFQAYDQLLDPKHQLVDAAAEARFNPKSSVAHNDLGIALANNRKLSQAIAQFNIAIRIDPRSTVSYMNRGVTENLSKQPVQALHDLEKARSLATDIVTQKKLDGAIAYLKKGTHQ